ncbi:MAG: histidine phosphatase family protein [Robiginitomaculum sp.]
MKTQYLMLMRHARAGWGKKISTDHERPLDERGRKDAKKMGDTLREKNLFPNQIWSSDSTRTIQTVKLMLSPEVKPDTLFLPSFYQASLACVFYVCEEYNDPGCTSLMFMGHNPGWEDLLFYYTGTSLRMPTTACAVLKRTDSDEDWLDKSCWQLADYILPKML